MYKKMLPFIKKCSSIFNKTVEQFSLKNLNLQFDVVYADKYNGRPFPQGFTQKDY